MLTFVVCNAFFTPVLPAVENPMKLTFILPAVFYLIFVILHCTGQSQQRPSLYLSGYTYSETDTDIGYVKIRPAGRVRIKSVRTEGEHEGVLRISKDHRLSVRKDKLKPGIDWLDVVLTASEGKRLAD
jgi:hypothetical protein